jgi:hypothetical protein
MLLIAGIAVLGSLIASGVLSQERGEVRKPQEPRKTVSAIPPTFSKVKTLQIVSTKVINENTPAIGVAVEIRNNSPKAVMAVDLVCGDGAITKNGLTDADKPIVVIEPFGTTTIEMTFGEMTYGAPLVISAATYQDGTEEGDEESLGIMHKVRERDRERMKTARRGDQ